MVAWPCRPTTGAIIIMAMLTLKSTANWFLFPLSPSGNFHVRPTIKYKLTRHSPVARGHLNNNISHSCAGRPLQLCSLRPIYLFTTKQMQDTSCLYFIVIIRRSLIGRCYWKFWTGWPKFKYSSSKFAISWQQHKILRPILQQLLSTNHWINPQNYAYALLSKIDSRIGCKPKKHWPPGSCWVWLGRGPTVLVVQFDTEDRVCRCCKLVRGETYERSRIPGRSAYCRDRE